MGSKARFVALALCLLFTFSCLAHVPAVFAQPAEQGKKATAQEKGAQDSESLMPGGENGPVPIQTEAIDEAGELLGKKIDQVGKGMSQKAGKWITAKAFLGITWLRIIVCMLLLLLVVILERLIRYAISLKIRKKEGEEAASKWWKLFFEALSKPLSLFLRIYGFYWALSPILVHFESAGSRDVVHRIAVRVADVGGTVALFWFVYRFVHVLDHQLRRWADRTQSSIDDMLVPLVSKTIRIIIITLGGILIVQNMTGIEIGPLIASLGIGGLAFALAGKDSIANFLGSLTILLDKPFQVGERVVIDSYDGFVENVGFRSTRLRTLTGHLVSIPNEKIINSTLENVGRRPHMRWNTNLTITYDTPPEKVERAVEIVREILRDHEGMREDLPPRVYFNGFNDWSLNIGVYAWYHPAQHWDYQAWVQRTCLEILHRFNEEHIAFAFPTQTVYQVGEDRKLELQVLQSGRL